MATAIKNQTLEELYQNPKMTPSVLKFIRQKEDFSHIQENYCKACPAPCKNRNPNLNGTWKGKQVVEAPVMVILPHQYINEERNGYVSVYGRDRTTRITTLMADLIRTPVFFSAAYICSQEGYNVPLKVVKHCGEYIKQLVRDTKPKVIVACGPNAVQSLGLKGSRGETLDWFGIPVVVTYDPRILFMIRQNSSGDNWGPDYLSVLGRDIAKVRALYTGKRPPSLEEAVAVASGQITVVKSIGEIHQMMSELEKEGVVSFDIETSTLDPWQEEAKILTVQFGTEAGDKAWVVTLWHKDMPESWYDPGEAWSIIAPLLADRGVMKVGHNIKFDALYVRVTKNLKVTPIEDTMLFLHSLNSGTQGEYGLKAATQDYLWESGLGGYEDMLSVV
jgi:uracil-DNA glycosylase